MKSTFSELITDEKEKSPWRGTIFNITINTQKSYNSKDPAALEMMPELKERFTLFLKSFFAENRLTACMVDLGRNGKKTEDGVAVEPAIIKQISAHTQIEANLDKHIRGSTGALHSHTIINVVHSSRLRINIPLIKRVASKFLAKYLIKKNGEPGLVYVSATARNSAYNSENYVKAGELI